MRLPGRIVTIDSIEGEGAAALRARLATECRPGDTVRIRSKVRGQYTGHEVVGEILANGRFRPTAKVNREQ